MGYMLLAPELVIMWAARQYFSAKEITIKHRGMQCTTRLLSLQLTGYNKQTFGMDKDTCIFCYHGRIRFTRCR